MIKGLYRYIGLRVGLDRKVSVFFLTKVIFIAAVGVGWSHFYLEAKVEAAVPVSDFPVSDYVLLTNLPVMQKHPVQSGETLYQIAKQYGVSVKEIMEENELYRPEQLQSGQVILVPHKAQADEQAQKRQKTQAVKATFLPSDYRIKAGDTLYSISRKWGISVDTLVSFNGLNDPNQLAVGQVIKMPASLQVRPVSVQSARGDSLRTQDVQHIEDRVSGYLGRFTLTAYTAGPESTGKSPGHPAYGITASGVPVQEGVTIAVDPRVIPIGSHVYIEGIGLRTAQDTGGAIQGNRIDVYMPGVQEALEFGVQHGKRVYMAE